MAILKSVGRIAGDLWNAGAGFAVVRLESKDHKTGNSTHEPVLVAGPSIHKRSKPMPIGRSAVNRVAYIGPQTIKNLPVDSPSDNIYIDPRSYGLSMSKDEPWQL